MGWGGAGVCSQRSKVVGSTFQKHPFGQAGTGWSSKDEGTLEGTWRREEPGLFHALLDAAGRPPRVGALVRPACAAFR